MTDSERAEFVKLQERADKLRDDTLENDALNAKAEAANEAERRGEPIADADVEAAANVLPARRSNRTGLSSKWRT